MFDRNRTTIAQNHQPPRNPSYRREEDKSKLVCSHCGGKKHTKDTCFHIHGFPEWWEEMKKARQARRSTGGGRASAAVALDRATNTETPMGGGGGSSKNRAEEKPTVASVSVARTWSEGEISVTESTTGDQATAARVSTAARVRNEGEAAARVSEFGGVKHIYIPNFRKLQIDPQNYPKFSPEPHLKNTSHKPPQNSPKFSPEPHFKNTSHKPPQKFQKYHNPAQKSPVFEISPHTARTLQIQPHISEKSDFQPTIPCHNSFEALACSSISTTVPEDTHWIFDCGATDTISFDASDFLSISKSNKSYVQTASGDLAQVHGAGIINISPTLRLSNCLFVPSLSHKLLSISHVTKELNCKLLMQPQFCMLQDIKTGTIVGRGTERCGLYYVDEIAQQSAAMMLTPGPTDRQAWLWHRRLGHPSLGYFRLLFPELATSLNSFHCDTCVLAKNHRHSFKLNNTRMRSPFALVHSDVWGPAPITGGKGFRYFVLFIDDYSRMTWIYFLKNKHEVFDKFVDFYKERRLENNWRIINCNIVQK